MFFQTSTMLAATNIGRVILFNAFGVLGIALQILLYQMQTRKKILYFSMVNHVAWFCYFAFQGDFLSGVSNVVGIVSNCVFLFRGKYRWADSKLWLVLFVAIAVTWSVLTFKGWRDIFPLLGCASSISAFFMLQEKNIRRISLFTFSMYFCNSLSKLYIVAIVADITALTSVVIALIRYSKKEKQNAQIKENE